MKRLAWLLINVFLLTLLGCGGGGGGSSPGPTPVPISVSISPAQATVVVSTTQAFTATVSGGSTAVTWFVNDVQAGNTAVGTINASGVYTAPDVPPSAAVVVKATSTADPTKSASATVSVVNPTPQPSSAGTSTGTPIVAGSADTTIVVQGAGFTHQSVVLANVAVSSGFARGAAVTSGATALVTTFVSPTQLTAILPATLIANGGTITLSVETPPPGGGTTVLAATLVIDNPVPAIMSLTPNPALVDSPATLTVNGTGFVYGSVVQWNGSARTTSFVSNTQLTAAISASDLTSPGTAQVTVFNPAPGGGPSGLATLAINNPVPVIATASPSSALVGGATFTLTVNGSNFVSGAQVQWNGSTRSTTFVSSTQLTASITATDIATASAGIPITVLNPAPGGGVSNGVTFAVNNPVPAISSLSSSSAAAGAPGFTLTVNGSNFVSGAVVQWNGSARVTTFVSGTRVDAAILASDLVVSGVANITVSNPAPGGGASNAASFSVVNPVPAITTLSPASVIAPNGSTSLTLTVNGSNFVPGSVVQWNSSPRSTTFLGGTQLTAVIPASDVVTGTTASITVVNSSPGGGTSNGVAFTVNNPAPVMGAISPSTVIVGGSAFTLTVNGSGFVPGSIVRWNGADRSTTYVNGGELTIAVAQADIASTGTAQVTVFNPTPAGGTSGAAALAINNPVPVVSAVAPNSALVGGAGFTVTVDGSNFVPGSAVQWNGSARTTTFVSSTELTATILASDLNSAAAVPVTVVNPAPGGGTSNANVTVALNNPVPVVTGLSSTSAIAGDPAFTLTVTGSNFVSGATVQWNGSGLPTTTFVSSTQLNAGISAADLASAAVITVSVANPAPGGGASTTSGTFTVNNPQPGVTSLSPASAVIGASAFTLTVNGTNFINGAVVQWNGSNRATTFVSGTQLTASISAADVAAAGTANVIVVNPSPSAGASAAATFTINNPQATITTLSPASTTSGSGAFTLTVTGTNFINGAVVQWNGSNRTTTFVSATQLTASISSTDVQTASTANVVVVNPSPTVGPSAAATFTINNPQPGITSLSPASTTFGSGAFTLTVNGTNFISGAVVQWNGGNRTTTFVSSTQLTASITASDVATVGTANIVVVNPNPSLGPSLAATFTINNPQATITGLSPASTTFGTGAFTLTVNGTNFINGAVVQWNGSNRTTTFVSSTQLTASIRAADVAVAGTASVVVVNPTPSAGPSSAATFTINNPQPAITSLSPASTTVGSGAFTLTVNGTSFINGAVVQWNGTNRTTTFVNSTQLTASITASDVAAVGTANVVVINPSPSAAPSSAVTFNINNPQPIITALSPPSVSAGSTSFTLTVSGTNFISGAVVQWNGSNRTTTWVSGTQLTASISSNDVKSQGTANVVVVNPSPAVGPSAAATFTIYPKNSAPTASVTLYAVNNGSVATSDTYVSFNNDYDCDSSGTTADYNGNGTAIQCAADKQDMITLALNVQPWDLSGTTVTLSSTNVSGSGTLVRVFASPPPASAPNCTLVADTAVSLPLTIDPSCFQGGAISFHAEGLQAGSGIGQSAGRVTFTLTAIQGLNTSSVTSPNVVVGNQIGINMTFDDGPDNNDLPNNQTYEVLSGLSSYFGRAVPATFFAQTNLPFHGAGDVGGPQITSEENEGSATQIHTGNAWDSTCDDSCTAECHSNATCALVCSDEWACDHISHCTRVGYPGYPVTGINGAVTGSNALQSDLIQAELQVKTLTTTSGNPNGSTPTLVRPPYGGYPRGDPACTATMWTSQVEPTYASVTPNALAQQYWDVDSGDTSSTCASSADPLSCLQNNLITGIQGLIPGQTSVVLLFHDDVAHGYAATYIQQLLKTVQKAVRYKGMNEVFGALGP